MTSAYVVLIHNGVSKGDAWRLRGAFDTTVASPDGNSAIRVVHHTANRKEAIAVHDFLIERCAINKHCITVARRHFCYEDGRWYQRLATPISTDPDLFNKPTRSVFSNLIEEFLKETPCTTPLPSSHSS